MIYVFAMSLRFSGLNYVFTGHFSTFQSANSEYAASRPGAREVETAGGCPYFRHTVSRQARQPSYPRFWILYLSFRKFAKASLVLTSKALKTGGCHAAGGIYSPASHAIGFPGATMS